MCNIVMVCVLLLDVWLEKLAYSLLLPAAGGGSCILVKFPQLSPLLPLVVGAENGRKGRVSSRTLWDGWILLPTSLPFSGLTELV